MPCSGQSLTRPDASLSWASCQRNFPSASLKQRMIPLSPWTLGLRGVPLLLVPTETLPPALTGGSVLHRESAPLRGLCEAPLILLVREDFDVVEEHFGADALAVVGDAGAEGVQRGAAVRVGARVFQFDGPRRRLRLPLGPD